MNPGLFRLVTHLDGLSPELSRRVMGPLLRLSSPFNAPLRASIEVWEPTCCRIRVPNRRPLRNHLGGIHAAALVTAGETPAGLLVVKNFPFSDFRPILKNLSTVYERQARTDLVAEVRVTEKALAAARAGIGRGEPQLITLKTVISEPEGARLAVVKTTWQVKAWSQVRGQA